MKHFKWVLLGLTLLLALGLTACDSEDTADTSSDKAESVANTNTREITTVAFRDAPLAIDADFHNDPAEAVAATGRPQLLEFFTFWCPTCKAMKPTVHSLEAEYWGKIDFVYLDREDEANAEWVKKYGVRGQPVFVLVEPDGTVVEQWFGGVAGEDLTTAIDNYLAQTGG